MKMIIKSTNKTVLGEVVCSFETDDNTKFIVLTNNSKNEQGLLNITAYYYEDKDNKLYLEPINNEDLPLVEEAINKLKEENN